MAYGAYGNFEKAKQLELQLQSNKNCDVKSFEFSDVSAKMHVKQDALCGGKYPVLSPITNASVYAERKGRWVNVFRASTPLPAAN